jgi:hypothetical protein
MVVEKLARHVQEEKVAGREIWPAEPLQGGGTTSHTCVEILGCQSKNKKQEW